MSASPQEWDGDVVNFIRDVLLRGSPASINKEYYATASRYASFNKNKIFEIMKITEHPSKPNEEDKLTNEEVQLVLNEAEGVERLIFHMGLQLNLRYREMLSLCVNDIYQDHVCVMRKDKYGTSLRTVIFHPDTKKELEKYEIVRNTEIRWAKRVNENVEVPDYLFIHQEKGELSVYSVPAIHYMMKKLSDRSGIKFTIKTLKNTNKEISPAIEERWDLVHGTQEVLDTYTEPDIIEENITAAVNGDEYLSSILSSWHKSPRGQEWVERQKMQSKIKSSD